jgi:hypothetical protein
MSNPFASNAIVTRATEKKRYLKVNKEGAPINKQVPRTYQNYTGTGGSLTYDGSNEIRINGSALTSPLIIQFGPTTNVRNWVGRCVDINIYTPNSRTITLNSSPAFMILNGTGLTQLSHVIEADGVVKTITVYFSSTTSWNVDYGAASAGVVPSPEPRAGTLTIEYPYGTESLINLPVFFIPNSTAYTLLYNDPEETKEGRIAPLTGGVTGPGPENLTFIYSPAPRRTDATTVTGYIGFSGIPRLSFSCVLKPILRNVYDREYFIACNSDSTTSMYDPFNDAGSSPLAVDVNGDKVLTDTDPIAIAVDIADSLLFYVLSSANTVIKWKSFITGERGDLFDVSTQPTSRWPSGTIQDIAFDEKASTLLVLSTSPIMKVLGIPIKPYDYTNPGTIEMGPVTASQLINLGAVVPYSIAVCPISRATYIAVSQPGTSISIYQLFPYPGVIGSGAGNLWTDPVITTGAVTITCTAVGTLLMLFENTRELYRVSNGGGINTGAPLSDIELLYRLPQFHLSLAPNCYGWRQG